MSKLKKNLGLYDVYAISTGAMFSSGFFLLPGLAAAQTGSSVVLAYLLAGLMIIPAMLSKAELATAMPKAGGSYFFIDRALGPLFGMISGGGTWIALVLKSAFALIGMGAYLALLYELPIVPVAIFLTLIFGVLNLVGAKESSGLQRLLVTVLLATLMLFIVPGLATTLGQAGEWVSGGGYAFARNGVSGIMATAGMVFVSYAGLTKVASVAEEVENPDRNIPLGMFLSLSSAVTIYCAGTYIMTVVLPPDELYKDLTPVATAAEPLLSWMPGPLGVWIMVLAATAAFASTGNAGLMAASRYPFAMARDRLLPDRIGRVSKRGIPTAAVVGTTGAMILCLVALDVMAVAKLASAFQLLLFGLTCLAVIVMREARLDFYQPGFRSPFYPWLHIAGVLIAIGLIWQLGWLAIGFSGGLVVLATLGYLLYADRRVHRRGAIRHVFANWGKRANDGLSHELRDVLSEKGLQKHDNLEEVLDRALTLKLEGAGSYQEVVHDASVLLADELGLSEQDLIDCFTAESQLGMLPISGNGAVPHHLFHELDHHHALVVHVDGGVQLHLDEAIAHFVHERPIEYFVFLLGPDKDQATHYRFVAELASRFNDPEPRDVPTPE